MFNLFCSSAVNCLPRANRASSIACNLLLVASELFNFKIYLSKADKIFSFANFTLFVELANFSVFPVAC
jgi:hypothetical protein